MESGAVQVIAGTLLGAFFGLFLPGIHQNSLSILLLPLGPFGILSGIVSQLFFSVPASVFLGVPSEGREGAVLPAHRMVLSGEGREAVLISLASLVLSLPATLLLLLPAESFLKSGNLPNYLSLPALAFFGIFLIYFEKRRLLALAFFAVAGFFGKTFISSETIFPAFAGLFGGATLVESVFSEKSQPKTNRSVSSGICLGNLVLPVLVGSFAGFFVGTFPALTVSVVALALSGIFGGTDTKGFLALSVSAGFSSFLFSLLSLFVSGKTRSGSIVSLASAGLKSASFTDISVAIAVPVAFGAFALFLISGLSERLAEIPFLNEASLALLFGTVGFFSGFYGLFIFLVSLALSLGAGKAGVGKRVLAGFIIVPAALALA